jgi:hypothetical protein
LRRHKVPLAIATSTSRVSFTAKMKSHPDLREAFQVGLHMISRTFFLQEHHMLRKEERRDTAVPV